MKSEKDDLTHLNSEKFFFSFFRKWSVPASESLSSKLVLTFSPGKKFTPFLLFFPLLELLLRFPVIELFHVVLENIYSSQIYYGSINLIYLIETVIINTIQSFLRSLPYSLNLFAIFGVIYVINIIL